jgi:hypothetical protein
LPPSSDGGFKNILALAKNTPKVAKADTTFCFITLHLKMEATETGKIKIRKLF